MLVKIIWSDGDVSLFTASSFIYTKKDNTLFFSFADNADSSDMEESINRIKPCIVVFSSDLIVFHRDLTTEKPLTSDQLCEATR